MTSDQGAKAIRGEFMLPIIDDKVKNSDPWQRNYMQPPPFDSNPVPISFPLIDVRPLLSRPDYTPDSLLKSHGFGVVKHRSPALEGLDMDGELAEQTIVEKYHPEIRELVTKVTGAKSVFITATGFRRGKRAPGQFMLPTVLKPMTPSASGDQAEDNKQDNQPVPSQNGQNGVNANQTVSGQANKFAAGQSRVTQAKPVRFPHMDFTPLGARQAIRFQAVDINKAAVESGVIAAEDEICDKHSVAAPTREADQAIAQLYNKAGKLGPRYAAYSIWRPTRRVERDPISLSPRKRDPTSVHDGMVYWPYDNKIPGTAELSGDYLKEYAMLGVQQGKTTSTSDPMEWYYVSRQEPDEVMFIKLFDSASVGEEGQHAPAPWHASPEIGDAEGDEPRESLDIRVIVFW